MKIIFHGDIFWGKQYPAQTIKSETFRKIREKFHFETINPFTRNPTKNWKTIVNTCIKIENFRLKK